MQEAVLVWLLPLLTFVAAAFSLSKDLFSEKQRPWVLYGSFVVAGLMALLTILDRVSDKEAVLIAQAASTRAEQQRTNLLADLAEARSELSETQAALTSLKQDEAEQRRHLRDIEENLQSATIERSEALARLGSAREDNLALRLQLRDLQASETISANMRLCISAIEDVEIFLSVANSVRTGMSYRYAGTEFSQDFIVERYRHRFKISETHHTNGRSDAATVLKARHAWAVQMAISASGTSVPIEDNPAVQRTNPAVVVDALKRAEAKIADASCRVEYLPTIGAKCAC